MFGMVAAPATGRTAVQCVRGDVQASSLPAFAQRVSVLVPGERDGLAALRRGVGAVVRGSLVYEVRGPLSALFDPAFLDAHVCAGALAAVSTGGWSDADNTLALLPTGKLVLSLRPETYHKLGLAGKACKKGLLHRVTIDLKAPAFRPGNKMYERVVWCFSGRHEAVHLLVTWRAPSGQAAPIEFPAAIQASPLRLASSYHQWGEPRCPTAAMVQAVHDDRDPVRRAELLEWLGLACVQLDGAVVAQSLGDASSGMIEIVGSAVDDDDPGSEAAVVHGIQIRGLVLPGQAAEVLDAVQQAVDAGSVPWAAVAVLGCEDSPVGLGQNAHLYQDTQGENDTLVFVLPAGKRLRISVVGPGGGN